MPYNEKLAEKVRKALSTLPHVSEKKMFGSLAFLVNDKMCIAAGAGRLMCRVEPDRHDELIKKAGTSTVVMGGRKYRGYVYVEESTLKTKKDLDFWVGLSLDFNKKAKSSKK